MNMTLLINYEGIDLEGLGIDPLRPFFWPNGAVTGTGGTVYDESRFEWCASLVTDEELKTVLEYAKARGRSVDYDVTPRRWEMETTRQVPIGNRGTLFEYTWVSRAGETTTESEAKR